jgi:hypothetical protein
MKPLWSPVVATSGNRRQMGGRRDGSDKLKSFAVGCDQLPESFHGKDGVDGSSPSEGSAKAQQSVVFGSRLTCTISSVRCVWSPLWSLQIRNATLDGRAGASPAPRARSVAVLISKCVGTSILRTHFTRWHDQQMRRVDGVIELEVLLVRARGGEPRQRRKPIGFAVPRLHKRLRNPHRAEITWTRLPVTMRR